MGWRQRNHKTAAMGADAAADGWMKGRHLFSRMDNQAMLMAIQNLCITTASL